MLWGIVIHFIIFIKLQSKPFSCKPFTHMWEYYALHSTEIIKLLAEITTTKPSGNIMSSYKLLIAGGRPYACIMRSKGPTVDPWRAPRVLTTGSRQCAAKTVPVLHITSVGSIRGTKARLHAFNLCVRWLSWRCSLSVIDERYYCVPIPVAARSTA
jgi:hypothetical protein